MSSDFSNITLFLRQFNLFIHVLELDIVEVGFHLELEPLLVVGDLLPNAFFPLLALGHKQELGKQVFLRLGAHYHGCQAGVGRADELPLHLVGRVDLCEFCLDCFFDVHDEPLQRSFFGVHAQLDQRLG